MAAGDVVEVGPFARIRVPLRVLLAAASTGDDVWQVAGTIARALLDQGTDVDLIRLGTTHHGHEVNPSRYHAVVLGSTVHDGRWLPVAHNFIAQHTAALYSRPVWLFSLAPVNGAHASPRRVIRIHGLVDTVGPVEQRTMDLGTDCAAAISDWVGEISAAVANRSAGPQLASHH